MTNKKIIIIGANGGIGKHIVYKLLREGYECIAVDKDESVNDLKKDGVEVIQVDLLSDLLLEKMKSVLENKTDIYGIVYAAGIMIPGKVTDLKMEEWNQTLEINLTAVYKITKIALPYLLQNKCSHIIAIASHLGVVGSYDLTAYSVSKAGLIEFIKCLALDYGDKGLMANCISPGFVKTKMTDKAISKFAVNKKWMFATGGLSKQYVDINDVVNAIIFLLNQESINGENIVIDAGYSVR